MGPCTGLGAGPEGGSSSRLGLGGGGVAGGRLSVPGAGSRVVVRRGSVGCGMAVPSSRPMAGPERVAQSEPLDLLSGKENPQRRTLFRRISVAAQQHEAGPVEGALAALAPAQPVLRLPEGLGRWQVVAQQAGVETVHELGSGPVVYPPEGG